MTGEKIRAYRNQLGLSQAAFADKIGIRQGHLSEIERGSKGIGGKVLKSLLRYYPDLQSDILQDVAVAEPEMPEKYVKNGRSTPVQTEVAEERILYSASNGPTLIYVAMGKAFCPEGSDIREGDRIIIDIEAKPQAGDYVLAKVGDGPGIVPWTPELKQWTGKVVKLMRLYQ